MKSASYGGNCKSAVAATKAVASACDGKTQCSYAVSHVTLTDPSPGCAKDFVAQYSCKTEVKETTVAAEASGKTAEFGCASNESVEINSATYGQNCTKDKPNNALQIVAAFCLGKSTCKYTISHGDIGDPSFGCAKDFVATYGCKKQETP